MSVVRQSYERARKLAEVAAADQPWLLNGKAWHLEQRCGPRGRDIVERLVELVSTSALDASGPHWRQKHYISWTYNGYNWAIIATRKTHAALNIWGSTHSSHDVASALGYEVFDKQADLSEKLDFGSSVSPTRDGKGLRIIVKEPADLDEKRWVILRDLLVSAWEGFQGASTS